MNKLREILTGIVIALAMSAVNAEVVSTSADYYRLSHKASSTMTPNELWQRLVQPGTWWHPDHTYSRDSTNLSLDLRAGGY